MVRRLATGDAGFAADFALLLAEKREADDAVAQTAAALIASAMTIVGILFVIAFAFMIALYGF